MLLETVLVATMSPAPSSVPDATILGIAPGVGAVVASLVVATASVVVTLISTSRQAQIARDDRTEDRAREQRERDADRAREDRAARVAVHSAITNRALELSAAYGNYLREIDEWSGEPQHEPIAPSNAPLNTALTGVLTSLGEEAVYRASVEYFGRMIMHLYPKDFLTFLSKMQQTLDDWFIGKTTAEQAEGVLLSVAGELRAEGERQTA